MILHAGLVALRLHGYWIGALIEGPSGAGKSDLALKALDAGFRLVADDRVVVWRSGDALFGRARSELLGLIEARGHGILREAPIGFARIGLVARCVSGGEAIERLPEPCAKTVAGIGLPCFRIDPFEASAPAKLRRALQHLGHAA